MNPTADDKAYASDTRKFSEGTVADGIHDVFEDSPISEHLQMKDVCVYAPGDLNKVEDFLGQLLLCTYDGPQCLASH